jgi:serine protease Do
MPLPLPHFPFRLRCEHVRAVALAFACLLAGASVARASDGAASLVDVARDVQTKVVKLYGAGGPKGLVAYQSGLLISGKGHVLR